MQYTSAQANKLIKQLEEEKALLLLKESDVSTFTAATVENIEEARPAYDYAQTLAEIEAVNRKIRKIKHAINVFNSTTLVEGFDMTIDELLVYLPQLNERVATLRPMASAQPKTRKETHPGGSIIEYIYANYDVEQARKDFTALIELKNRAQTALDLTNSTKTMEIDI